MREAINIVRGAVAKKSLLPVLTHFRIYDGRIQGGNGRLSIEAPCPELAGLDICVPADRFVKAVDACDGEPKIKITDGGKLSMSRGSFRAILPLLPPDDYPLADRRGLAPVTGIGDWLPVFRALAPFIGEDASKMWATGIWLSDGFAYATNNAALARMPVPWSSMDEPLIVPGFAVDELLRIGQEPDGVCHGAGGVLFDLPGGAWLRSMILDGGWPNSVQGMLAGGVGDGAVESAAVLDAVRKVRPFCPSDTFPQIHLQGDGVRTEEGEMSAHVAGLMLPECRWHADVLELVLGNSDRVDFSQTPCPWDRADGLHGIALPLQG
jgi:hypothetical protein